MKTIFNIKNIIGAVSFMIAASSCSDFLDTPPSDLLSSDGFYQSATQAEQGILGIYSSLRYVSDYEYLYMSECRSDNTWVEPQTNGLREYSEIGTFRAGYDITTFNSAWNTWYKVIYNANVAIAKIPGCDFGVNEGVKDQFLGEAYFLRGWAYFELVRLFGSVPLIDAPLLPDAVKEIPQSTAREIIDKIVIPDLKEAKSKLPVSNDLKDSKSSSIAKSGRADQIAAQAMLGRVYMTLAGFPFNDTSAEGLAEVELKSVITYSETNNNKYWAADSTEWRKQWMPTDDYYNKYSVFAIQYRTGGSGNPAIFNYSPGLPKTYTEKTIFGNSIWVEKSLMYEFDKTYTKDSEILMDARGRGFSILTGYDAEPNYPAYSQPKEELTLPDGSKVDVLTHTMIYKYVPTKRKITALGMSIDAETAMKDNYDWGVNLPIIRYEDVLLMYAEIQASKDVAGAVSIVNRIRERMGCEPVATNSAAEAMEFIKRERRIEFLGEGIRWFDLIRYGEWKSAITNMFNRYGNPAGTDVSDIKDGRYLYPIPLNQMNVKPGFYKQNEGYN